MIRRIIRRFKRWRYKRRLNKILEQPLEDIYDFATDDIRTYKGAMVLSPQRSPTWNKKIEHKFHLDPISIEKGEDGTYKASSPLKPNKQSSVDALKLKKLFENRRTK